MVVVRSDSTYCTCLPISTYGGRGTAKPGINAAQHAIIYSLGTAPERFVEEQNLLPTPIEVIKSRPEELPLDPRSRVNLGKCYTVEYNVQVRNLGIVTPASLSALINGWRMVIFNTSNARPQKEQLEALARLTERNISISRVGGPHPYPTMPPIRRDTRRPGSHIFSSNYPPSEVTHDSSQTLVNEHELTAEEIFMYPGWESQPRNGIKEVDRATMIARWQENIPEMPIDIHSTLSTVHEHALSELRAFGSNLVNVDIDIPWELAGFLADNFPRGQSLGSILVFDGTARSAQALTVAEYLHSAWGIKGRKLLDLLETVLSEFSSAVSAGTDNLRQCFKSKSSSSPLIDELKPFLSSCYIYHVHRGRHT